MFTNFRQSIKEMISGSRQVDERLKKFQEELESRPPFMMLQPEMVANCDRSSREIFSPARGLFMGVGYAECCNAYAMQNRDFASIHRFSILYNEEEIPIEYYALFDSDDGNTSSVLSGNRSYKILEKGLMFFLPKVLNFCADGVVSYGDEDSTENIPKPTFDEMVCGFLSEFIMTLDGCLLATQTELKVSDGCSAIVVLNLLGKCYISNLGLCTVGVYDSGKFSRIMPQHTIDYHRAEIQKTIFYLHNEIPDKFTRLQYANSPTLSDIDKVILVRDFYHSGWNMKQAKEEDIDRIPAIINMYPTTLFFKVKQSRGIGFHGQMFDFGPEFHVEVRQLVTSEADIKVLDLTKYTSHENVLILGTSGFWSGVTEQEVEETLKVRFSEMERGEKRFYQLLAVDLVKVSRGVAYRSQNLSDNRTKWRKRDQEASASYDDISLFVIPLYQPNHRITVKDLMERRCKITEKNLNEAEPSPSSEPAPKVEMMEQCDISTTPPVPEESAESCGSNHQKNVSEDEIIPESSQQNLEVTEGLEKSENSDHNDEDLAG